MPSARPKTITLHSQLYDPQQRSPLLNILWPVAQLKQMLQVAYDLIFALFWAELTQRQSRSSPGATLVIVGVFAILSLFAYYTREYDLAIFLGIVVLWGVDIFLAKRHYGQGKHHKQLWLKIFSDHAEIILQQGNGEQQCAQFGRTQVLHIEIVQAAVRGGLFREKLGWVWRVYLVRRDQSRCLVYEKRQAIAALRGAKQLSRQFFHVPVWFADSVGLGAYAAVSLDLAQRQQCQHHPPSTLRIRQGQHQWHLSTHWNHCSFGHMAKEVLYRSGFLLFLVIMANLLQITGGILHATVITSFTQPIGSSSTFDAIPFELELPDVIEGLFALGFIVFKGWQISQEEHLLIDRQRLTFRLNHRTIGQLKTADIETVVYVTSPRPCLLICDRHDAVLIVGLQVDAEFQGLMVALEDAIAQLCPKPTPQKSSTP